MTLNSNQLQNHAKFITVHDRWAVGAPHDHRTRDHESGAVGYLMSHFHPAQWTPNLYSLGDGLWYLKLLLGSIF